MRTHKTKRANLTFKIPLLCIVSLTFSLLLSGCARTVDLRRLDLESQKHCPENMMYIGNGTFMMGNNYVSDESPTHEVSLDPFCIDKFEYPNIRGSRPEVGLNYIEAQEKCVNSGKRLCTETEWEHACRGNLNNLYPWGNEVSYTNCYIGRIEKYKTGSYDFCYSEFGVFDMSGGVWEWTSDWYASYPGRINSFSEVGIKRVLRGGYWLSTFDPATCTSRFPLEYHKKDIQTIGARCCKSLEPTEF